MYKMSEVFIDKDLVKDGEGVIFHKAIQIEEDNFDEVIRFASDAIVGRSIVTPTLLDECSSIDESDIGKECVVVTFQDDVSVVLLGGYLVKHIGKVFTGEQELEDDFYTGYLGVKEDDFYTTFVTPEEFYENMKIAANSIE